MAHRIVILGAGTGGSLAANRLRRECGDDTEIVVVDRDDDHVYQPGLLFVPFGLADPAAIVRSRAGQLRPGIDFRIADVDRVDVERSVVLLGDDTELAYDVLVIATGAELLPEETEGMTGPGWGDSVFTFYTLAGATGLRDALRPPGRELRRPADQVPGGAARVLLPGRLVPAQAWHPRPGRPAVRDAA
jgi:sulfide:quinone oxidoreductase